MAILPTCFGNNAFGDIAATKIALCHQFKHVKISANEKSNGPIQVKNRQGGRKQTTGASNFC
jgi:hypothetical protein